MFTGIVEGLATVESITARGAASRLLLDLGDLSEDVKVGDSIAVDGACLTSLLNGASCSGAEQCNSGYCATGVCCDALCDLPCESCDQAGSEGSCLHAPEGQPSNGSCEPFLCDGVGPECPNVCTEDGSDTPNRPLASARAVGSANTVLPFTKYSCSTPSRIGCSGCVIAGVIVSVPLIEL